MTEVERLIKAYQERITIPWQSDLAAQERHWFLVYPPELERRVRHGIPAFQSATEAAGKVWNPVDLTDSFAVWMARHEFRDDYFASPGFMEADAFDPLRDEAIRHLRDAAGRATDDAVTAVIGAASLFGFVQLSTIISQPGLSIPGRLLVFFPGSHDEHSYHLLNARSTFTYQASPITAAGVSR